MHSLSAFPSLIGNNWKGCSIYLTLQGHEEYQDAKPLINYLVLPGSLSQRPDGHCHKKQNLIRFMIYAIGRSKALNYHIDSL